MPFKKTKTYSGPAYPVVGSEPDWENEQHVEGTFTLISISSEGSPEGGERVTIMEDSSGAIWAIREVF